MTYHFGRYWAEIRPIHSSSGGEILYWQYRVFESGIDNYVLDGHDADFENARATAEAHIDRLIEEDRKHWNAA